MLESMGLGAPPGIEGEESTETGATGPGCMPKPVGVAATDQAAIGG
jgi:hypothetical protein